MEYPRHGRLIIERSNRKEKNYLTVNTPTKKFVLVGFKLKELARVTEILTGSSNSSINPALSIFHWFASVAQELLKDLAASSPNPRADTILETPFKFAFQKTVVVVGMHLESQTFAYLT